MWLQNFNAELFALGEGGGGDTLNDVLLSYSKLGSPINALIHMFHMMKHNKILIVTKYCSILRTWISSFDDFVEIVFLEISIKFFRITCPAAERYSKATLQSRKTFVVCLLKNPFVGSLKAKKPKALLAFCTSFPLCQTTSYQYQPCLGEALSFTCAPFFWGLKLW